MEQTFNSTRCIRNNTSVPASVGFGPVFQLHTVHQEQQFLYLSQLGFLAFQLHTVHQEQLSLLSCRINYPSFNSTRCIRNRIFLHSEDHNTINRLSTPHGALGTHGIKSKSEDTNNHAFNSTRCIRNLSKPFLMHPHQPTFNSTRCIRN